MRAGASPDSLLNLNAGTPFKIPGSGRTKELDRLSLRLRVWKGSISTPVLIPSIEEDVLMVECVTAVSRSVLTCVLELGRRTCGRGLPPRP